VRKTHLDLLSLQASALLAADSVLSVQHDRGLCRRGRPLLFKVRDIFNLVGCE
jgi:hypothetical protein